MIKAFSILITRKIHTALLVLKKEGWAKFSKRVLHLFLGLFRISDIFSQHNGHSATDECQIVFDVLSCRGQPGLMVDVGAHWGSSLKMFAESKWWILAFEPDKDNRKILESKFCAYSNVVIDPRALLDKEKESVDFYTSQLSSGISGLSAFHSSHKVSGKVNTTTLASVVKEFGISEINFLKIDTEGFDLLVLKGAPWGILKPEIIVCEFEDTKTTKIGYNIYDIADYLVEKGYKLFVSEWYPIAKYGTKHRWKKLMEYPSNLDDPESWGNLIAVLYEKDYELLKQQYLELIKR